MPLSVFIILHVYSFNSCCRINELIGNAHVWVKDLSNHMLCLTSHVYAHAVDDVYMGWRSVVDSFVFLT